MKKLLSCLAVLISLSFSADKKWININQSTTMPKGGLASPANKLNNILLNPELSKPEAYSSKTYLSIFEKIIEFESISQHTSPNTGLHLTPKELGVIKDLMKTKISNPNIDNARKRATDPNNSQQIMNLLMQQITKPGTAAF
jgi:hypothetical protein